MKEKSRRKGAASAAVLSAGIMWGCIGIFVRYYNAMGMGTIQVVGIRAVFTVLLLTVILLPGKRSVLKIRLKDLWCFFGTGVLSIVFFNYCYMKTMALTSLSVAAVLLYTAPAMVMVMSAVLFKEPMTKRKSAALVLAFAGCVLVTGMIGSEFVLSWAGLLTGLGAGFGYALYTIFGRYALERGYSSMTITFYTFVFAALAVFPFMQPGRVAAAVFSGFPAIGLMLLFVLTSTILPYFFYTWGLDYVENGMASILASVEPVVAALISVFVFRETMTGSQLLGVILVLASIVICNMQDKSREDREESY
ncbi:MAG: EamA family transporter [Eubacterium sp.]|nr:EamA family transporter [Eubacterium sp.]